MFLKNAIYIVTYCLKMSHSSRTFWISSFCYLDFSLRLQFCIWGLHLKKFWCEIPRRKFCSHYTCGQSHNGIAVHMEQARDVATW